MLEVSFSKRVFMYFGERFNLAQFIPLSLILSAVLACFTQMFLYKNFSVEPFLLSSVALFFFLLRLRIFDEFKDFEHDLKHYSERPLQRGLISKKELIKILVPVLLIEVIIAYLSGFDGFVLFIFASGYSFLMLKEFYIQNWLKSHFTVYIFSHEILLFPLFFYICAINGFKIELFGNVLFWFLVVCVGSLMFLLEITRKVRPKEHEVASRDTYTAQYGIWNTSIALIVISLISIFSLWQLLVSFTGNSILIITGSLFFFCIFLWRLYTFNMKPSLNTAKKVFLSSIYFVFITCILAIIFFIK